jgi:sulfonate transport system substrate-binding protein
VKFVLLQHPDGRTALIRGDVDAWAGLDPMMAAAELDEGAVLFYRKPEANTWGILNVREEFANKHPHLVQRVLKVYEQGRRWALANPDQVTKALAEAAKIPAAVAAKQLQERTELTHSAIGKPQRDSILAAGIALQKAGVIDAKVNIEQVLNSLIDERFNATLSN